MSELDWIDKENNFESNKPEKEETPESLEELVAGIEAAPDKDFEDLYGFKHDCRCAQDWLEGNTGMVAECYTKMTDDALNRCHEYKGEVAHLKRKIGVLRDQLREKGEEPRV